MSKMYRLRIVTNPHKPRPVVEKLYEVGGDVHYFDPRKQERNVRSKKEFERLFEVVK